MNELRIGGLASGIDTESLVQQLMRAERMPLDRMVQRQQTLEWQRDQYREINKTLLDFSTYTFDNMLLESNFIKSTAVSSNEDVLSVKALATAGNLTASIDRVVQLASATRWASNQTANFTAPTENTTLSFQVKQPGQSTFTTKTVEIKKNATLNDVIATINKSDLGISAFYDEFTKKVIINSKEQGAGAELKINSETTATFMQSLGFSGATNGRELGDMGTGSQTIWKSMDPMSEGTLADLGFTGGATFTFDLKDATGTTTNHSTTFASTDTMEDVVSWLNTISGLGAQVTEDGRVSIELADGGSASSFTPSDSTTVDLLSKLGFNNAAVSKDLGDTNGDGSINSSDFSVRQEIFNGDVKTNGQNAIFTYNGLTTERTTNKFTISGVEYTLKETTSSPVSISTEFDIDAMVDHILKFVEKYNEMIEQIHDEVTEERFRDYKPLTDEQKEAMEEKEIELWEEKAKSGLLRRDPILTGALGEFRMGMYTPVSESSPNVNNLYNQLTEIGIVTSKDYLEGGKLLLDVEARGDENLTGEDRLRKALKEDPYAVFALFSSDGTSNEEKGIARRLRETVQETIKNIEKKAGNSTDTLQNYIIGKDLLDVNKQIADFEEKLARTEERYWDQFTAMESALQKLNQQSAYLMQQLGMGAQ